MQKEDNSVEVRQRKTLKLYQMIWSGLTKIMLSHVCEQGKAVEIPDFAIFGPVVDRFTTLKDPLDKGPGRK